MDSNGQRFIFHVSEEEAQRIDKFLIAKLPDLSRSRAQNLIDCEKVTINDRFPKKSGEMLKGGEVVSVLIPSILKSELIAQEIPLNILFENDNVLVINKPAGMVVHPSVGHADGTLVNAILGYETELEGIGGEERPGIVHRLDKETSGVIIVAKNETSLHWLQEEFRSRAVKKTYIALVDGKPTTPRGRIEAPIGRDINDRKKMAITTLQRGREAISEYLTLENFDRHTLLEFHPLTGRTHQVRLHCAFLGCPIVGDMVYGKRKLSLPIDRHFLHSGKLVIRLPGNDFPSEFIAPLPEELKHVLENLRGKLLTPGEDMSPNR